MNADPVLRLENIHKFYTQGNARLEVLKGISLAIKPGEIVSLIGPSGCGKSTLLQIAGLLDVADSGLVEIAGHNASAAGDRERTALRRKTLGFVYQFHHLLPEFSALENVIIPQMINGNTKAEAALRAKELLAELGLSARENHRPAELSGGEQQRVAIARALASAPALLLADEPTGNLDPDTAQSVFSMFLNLAQKHQQAMLLVTHNPELAEKTHRVIRL